MEQRVGTCSICGGDVMGHRGAWYAVGHPPADHCVSCGARRGDDVIPMTPHRPLRELFPESRPEPPWDHYREGLDRYRKDNWETPMRKIVLKW